MQNVRFIALLSMSFMISMHGAATEGLFLLVANDHEQNMTFIEVRRQTTISQLKEKIARKENVNANDLEVRARGSVLKDNSTVRAAVDVDGKWNKSVDLTHVTPCWRVKQPTD